MQGQVYSLRVGDRFKAESGLLQAIRKATTPDESAPKQKHVRKIIVFTWDFKTSIPVWNGLQSQPLISNEVSCFKALITIHKFIRNGAQMCIPESLQKTSFLEALGKSGSQGGWKGYGILIHAYSNYILAKLEYHRLHPEFNGCFDYEEYVSLRGTYDPNEGYETIADLMSLQDRLDELQRLIFRNFTPGSNNECKISALVPLVEESYGIYKFATRMLVAMHGRVEGAEEALEPLRERYSTQHHRLRKFYSECSKLRYLTSLITVPKLGQDPPSVLGDGNYIPPDLPEREVPESPVERNQSNAEAERLENERKERERQRVEEEKRQLELQARELQRIEQERMMVDQQAKELQRSEMEQQAREQMRIENERKLMEQQALEQQRQFEELQRQRMLQEQMQMNQQRQVAGKIQEHEQQIALLNSQHERDMLTINHDSSKDELIRSLQAQIEQWKQKYDALAKLYAQLRQEHFDLLGRYKLIFAKAASVDETNEKLLQMQEFVKSKNLELAELMGERDKARFDASQAQAEASDQIKRLEKEIRDMKDLFAEKLKQKANEMADLNLKFNSERHNLESKLNEISNSYGTTQREFDGLQNKFDDIIQEKDDEIAILQASMDQSIIALVNAQKQAKGSHSDLQNRLKELAREHAAKLLRILDSVLLSCSHIVVDSIYEHSNPAFPGSTHATPSFVLAQMEQINESANSLATSFSGYLINPEGEQTQLIRSATDFASLIGSLLPNMKGITRFSVGYEELENLNLQARTTAEIANEFFVKGQSGYMQPKSMTERPVVIMNINKEFQNSLNVLSHMVEELIPREGVETRPLNVNEDLSEIVDREMMNAASAVETATNKIQEMMSRGPNPNLSDAQAHINDSILDNVLKMTNVIMRLIQASTISQQEIVASGKGSNSRTAFYKQHNRWTEGLISAAKAVAMATNILVEVADDVINEKKSIEDLVVAAREVTASTAQLVAASRVKSQLHSKALSDLEVAAKAVMDVSKELVGVVTALSERANMAKEGFSTQEEETERRAKVIQSWTSYEFKANEMEQKVAILKLEKELISARRRLADMRKFGYHDEDSDTNQ
ncbi:hypothetical protein BB558_002698 [Smittium angustum]|uniref:I/LWEQ domain-containing protein n=1 Tax=Smittium angustum TaxID=133377 RepID=A0A2U1J837_SMIAN|nr:hypothetical protein BB558_002698 [Smittium angustum]